MLTVTTTSLAETQELAAVIGRVLKGGEVFEFISDVGGGKTSFIKGLARGLGIDSPVQSPTFTISRIYKARDSLTLCHFDFYRLQEAGIVADELAETLTDQQTIIAIEWGEVIHAGLPALHATITISSSDEQSRTISFEFPKTYQHIVQGINDYIKQRNIA